MRMTKSMVCFWLLALLVAGLLCPYGDSEPSESMPQFELLVSRVGRQLLPLLRKSDTTTALVTNFSHSLMPSGPW